MDFNPRAPCGARLVLRGEHDAAVLISTHAPLAGRDVLDQMSIGYVAQISTHAPLAGRDVTDDFFLPSKQISTHAPLAGRDQRTAAR